MKVVKIPYSPHPAQKQAHDSPARFKILACGRRFGKDRFQIQETFRRAMLMAQEPRPPSLVPRVHVWTIAPNFPMLRQTWAEMVHFFMPTGLVKRKDEAESILEFRNGVKWELKSADKPETLVGVGLDILSVTETARVKEAAWTENLRPTLSSPKRGPGMVGKGLGLFNSSPKGRNWFYELWIKGQKTIRDRQGNDIPNPQYDPEYESFQFPTWANPHINPDEVEAARRDLPQNVFDQEYGAIFLDDAAGVFINLTACAKGELGPAVPGRQYAIGVDIAYQQDWTVITVIDVASGAVVHWERFQSPLWELQAPRIEWAARTYNNAPILLDVTGIGFNSVELMRGRLGFGHRVEGYYFTQDAKERLITQLQLAFQTKTISYPADLDILRDELVNYEYTYTKGGRFRYSAPQGMHDDCVISLALAVEAMKLGPYEAYCDEY